MFKITCPECANVFELETAEAGSFIECPACHMTLNIESIDGDEVKVNKVETDK
jgi:Zn finger protein HypA/HybF involved in hydrogenase expression